MTGFWFATISLLAAAQDASAVTYGDVELANDLKKPILQGQAMEKVFTAGPEAAAPIVEFTKGNPAGMNGLTMQFTQRLATVDDPAIIRLLVRMVGDASFFWRPAAMTALAERAGPEELESFRRGLTDRLWGVRAAAILGLDRLEDAASLPEIRKRLADEVFDVRAQAAKTLAEFGDESGLPVLVAALRDTTQWFDIDYGQFAREAAFNFLKKYTGLDFGFRAWEPASKREPAAAKWEEWIEQKFPNWREMVPESARPKSDASEYLFGFELRSCQRGDFFFRVDTAGEIVLGYFNLTRSRLTREQFERFREAIPAISAVDPYEPPGRPGCDFEKYYVLSEEGGYDTPLVYIKGRPGAMDGFIRACLEMIEAHFGKGQAEELRDRAGLFRAPD